VPDGGGFSVSHNSRSSAVHPSYLPGFFTIVILITVEIEFPASNRCVKKESM
jgi:hypothetical protein